MSTTRRGGRLRRRAGPRRHPPRQLVALARTTTVLGLLALVFFGLRGIPGVESVYVLARAT